MNSFKKATLKLFALTLMIFMSTGVMAQSNNTLTKNVIIEEKGHRFSSTNAPRISIDLKDPIEYNGQPVLFYVNLQGAKWLDAIGTPSAATSFQGAVFNKISDTELEVKITQNLYRSQYYIPLLTEMTGGEAKVSIDGGTTQVTSMAFTTFAITSDQKASVSAGNVLAVREEGLVGNIIVQEIIKGSLVAGDLLADRTITLTLLNSNYEFENDKPEIEPGRGFYGLTGIATSYGSYGSMPDKEVLRITLPQRKDITIGGRLNISKIKVKAKSNVIKTGNIQIKVSGPHIEETIVTVAEIKNYGISVTNRLSNPAQIKVGNKNNISFAIKENVLDSMLPRRTVEIILDKGYFASTNNEMVSDLSIGNIKLNNEVITNQILVKEIRKNGFLVGFSFDIPAHIDNTKINEIQINDVSVYAPAQVEGNVKVFVNIVGVADEASAQVAVIQPLTTVSLQPIRLKVGLKNQKGGTIIIKETDRDMIKAGIIELEIESLEGITFEKEPIVTVVEGDIKLGNVRYDGIKRNMLKIEVLRTSRNASTIKIENFIVTTDRSVPDGGYKLTVKGSSFVPDTELGVLEYDDFMIIGEPPVEIEPVLPIEKVVSKFILGSAMYDVDGERRFMDAKAYAEEGRIMVPVRYVADAIGITGKDIKYANNIVTIITPEKTILLYGGQNRASVGGQETTISGKVVMKEGRTYVPVAEIARLLGINVMWEPQTKMAIFEK